MDESREKADELPPLPEWAIRQTKIGVTASLVLRRLRGAGYPVGDDEPQRKVVRAKLYAAAARYRPIRIVIDPKHANDPAMMAQLFEIGLRGEKLGYYFPHLPVSVVMSRAKVAAKARKALAKREETP